MAEYRVQQIWARLRETVTELWQRRAGRWGMIGALVAIAAFVLLWFLFARGLPSTDDLLRYQPPLPTHVRDINGEPIHEFARERRVYLTYEELPPRLVQAFISAEDKTFFTHGGLDYPGIVSAIWNNLWSPGRPVGASTITQQVAKNLGLGNELSYTRKIREAILAKRLESALTKQQIIELYLNQIFLGRNAYGVQAAARAYFNKDVGNLDLAEIAYLAVLPKAPNNYTPTRHYERAVERRNWVLGQMAENGYISEAERDAARALPLAAVRPSETAQSRLGSYFIEEVRRQLIEKYGETAEDGPNSVYAGGLWVRTSIDPVIQKAAENALRDGLVRYDRQRGWRGPADHIEIGDGWPDRLRRLNLPVGYEDWRAAVILSKSGDVATIGLEDGSTGRLPAYAANWPKRNVGGRAFDFLKPGDVIPVKRDGGVYALRQIPEIGGGMVVQDPRTGRVLAMVGGFDSRRSQFNRATQAMRQPGSSFKPFVYSAALDSGMTPATLINDAPFCVYQSALLGRKCFRNFTGGYAGRQTMRWGVEQSRNLMTVRAASETGMEKVVKLAKDVGIGDYLPVLAMSLGAGETTVMKLTNAYAILANGGKALEPTLIDLIQDRHGKIIYRVDTRPCEGCKAANWSGRGMPRPPERKRQAMDPMTAYQMVHIMEGVVQRGTATVLRDLDRPLFGKTGTTSGPTDVWFLGGSPDLVAGVYLGYDKPQNLGGWAQGGTVAAPIFKQMAQVAYKDRPKLEFIAPRGIRMVRIDRKTGRRVFGAWPTDDPKSAVIWEAFKPESEPRRVIRRDPVAAAAEQAANAPVRSDSDFLQSQGGIY